MTKTLAPVTPFKRIPVGAKFIVLQHAEPRRTFKKFSARSIFRMNENGTGDTANKIPFTTGNSRCQVTAQPKNHETK